MNLCRPFFAAQVIRYVFEHCCQDTDTGEVEIRDGEAVLESLGYTDFYQDIWIRGLDNRIVILH